MQCSAEYSSSTGSCPTSIQNRKSYARKEEPAHKISRRTSFSFCFTFLRMLRRPMPPSPVDLDVVGYSHGTAAMHRYCCGLLVYVWTCRVKYIRAQTSRAFFAPVEKLQPTPHSGLTQEQSKRTTRGWHAAGNTPQQFKHPSTALQCSRAGWTDRN